MFDFLENWPMHELDLPPRQPQTTVKIIEELEQRGRHTPDFRDHRLKEDILVFVYCNYMHRGYYHHFFRDFKYLGVARTASNLYVMKNDLYEPVVFDVAKNYNGLKGFVKGEVYAIPPEALLMLDKVKNNREVFLRRERTVFLMEQYYKSKEGQKCPTVKAQMYLGSSSFWNNKGLTTSAVLHSHGFRDKPYFEFFPLPQRLH